MMNENKWRWVVSNGEKEGGVERGEKHTANL